MKTFKEFISEGKELFIIFKDNEPYEVATGRDVAKSYMKDYESHSDNKGAKFVIKPLKGIEATLKKLKPKSYKKLQDLKKQHKSINEGADVFKSINIDDYNVPEYKHFGKSKKTTNDNQKIVGLYQSIGDYYSAYDENEFVDSMDWSKDVFKITKDNLKQLKKDGVKVDDIIKYDSLKLPKTK